MSHLILLTTVMFSSPWRTTNHTSEAFTLRGIHTMRAEVCRRVIWTIRSMIWTSQHTDKNTCAAVVLLQRSIS